MIKDIVELLKEQRMLMMFAVTSFILLSLPYEMVADMGRSDASVLIKALDVFVIYFSMMGVLFISYAAVYRVFYREKNSGTLSALLATPLNIRQIWLGKTLAVALVGYLFSLVLTAAFVVIVDYASGTSVLPSWSAITILVLLIPLISVLLVALLGIMYLLIKDEMKARIGFFMMIFGGFYFLKTPAMPSSAQIMPYLLILVLLLLLINGLLLRLLSNERVVLSMDR